MMTMHTFVVDPAEEARSTMASALGDEQAWIAHDSLPQVAQSIDGGSLPAVVLVGPGIVHDDTIMLADSVQDERLPVRLIQFTKVLDPDRLRDAMRAGVADVVEVGADAVEVQQAVARARRELAALPTTMSVAEAAQPTPVVAVLGGKGGVGSSLVATNLATALSGRGVDVGLIDLDVASGDLAIMLQQRPSFNILDAIDRIDHLDLDAVSGFLTRVNSHLLLLPAPLETGESQVPTGAFMRVLGLVQDLSDVVLVDIGQGSGSTVRAVLSEAREVLVVTTREVTSIRGTLRVLGELEAIGVRSESVSLVVNESDAATGLSMADLEKALRRDVTVGIPGDKQASRSVNQGDPLVNRRRSKAGQAMAGIATRLVEALGLADSDE